MDHFALRSDSLHQASVAGDLHRNFMGYTTSHTKMMVGLGVSAIGDCWTGFAQNVKHLEDYHQLLEWGKLPIVKGHLLTGEDLIIRQHIQNLMCRFQTSWENPEQYFSEIPEVLASLSEMQHDGLLEMSATSIKVTNAGKAFVRNICMAFDLRMKRNVPDTQLFSMTV